MAYTDIDDASLFFRVKLYNGNNNPQNIAFDETHENMQPDLVWIKSRSGNTVFDHVIGNSASGGGKYLKTNQTTSETSNNNVIYTFNTNGFSVGGATFVSEGGRTYVAWSWKESSTAGFDLVTYTGNSSDGTTTQDISHSLSAVPHWIIVKNRADSTNWAVYHKGNTSAPETEVIYLNATSATSDDSAFFGDTAPTSSQFRVGGDNGVNGNSDSMIAYVWSEVKGFSKFGSFVGNADANGPFVYTGFRPAWVLIKNISAGGENWNLFDNKRNGFNGSGEALRANTGEAEYDRNVDFLANGFKIRDSSGEVSGDGNTLIYMAFAESPFVNSNGVPTNAR